MNERQMTQSLAVSAQNSNTFGEASASAVTMMGMMAKGWSLRLILWMKKWWQRRRSLRERTRVWKTSFAIQEHAKKSQHMEEDIAKLNAGETLERTTRRWKSIREKYKGQSSPSFITFNDDDDDDSALGSVCRPSSNHTQ